MPQATVRMFGAFEVSRKANPACRFQTNRSRDLLASLLLEPQQRIVRDVLLERLWPECEPDKARRSLDTEIWRLRGALRDGGISADQWLVRDGDTIGLCLQDDTWVDVHRFSELVRLLHDQDQKHADEGFGILREISTLYRDDLLAGVYEDWCIIPREILRNEFLASLERLLAHLKDRADWPAALRCARQILRLEPLFEHVHREVMRCFASLGDRPAAVKHYREFEQKLGDELDCVPMDETKALLDAIRQNPSETRWLSGGRKTARPIPGSSLTKKLDATISSLNHAVDTLEGLRTTVSSLRVPRAGD